MFECRWGVVCWGSAAEDLARGTVKPSVPSKNQRTTAREEAEHHFGLCIIFIVINPT